MIISIIVGVITGIIASVTVWWILFHKMAPQIGFAENIKKAKSENTKTGYYYQFKIGNLKRRASAVDVWIKAVLYLPEFPSAGMTNIYLIPTGSENIFEFTPRKEGHTGWQQRISLKINDDKFTIIFDRTYFSDQIKSLAKEKMLRLEDILSITPNAFIIIYVSAMDSFSGSKKVFKSKEYKLKDIIYGQYERSSFRLIPMTNENT